MTFLYKRNMFRDTDVVRSFFLGRSLIQIEHTNNKINRLRTNRLIIVVMKLNRVAE